MKHIITESRLKEVITEILQEYFTYNPHETPESKANVQARRQKRESFKSKICDAIIEVFLNEFGRAPKKESIGFMIDPIMNKAFQYENNR